MQRKPGSTEDTSPRRENAVAPSPAPRGAPLPATPRATNDWLGSSFDLAQGLDVKVMESKLSRETLDQLFRS